MRPVYAPPMRSPPALGSPYLWLAAAGLAAGACAPALGDLLDGGEGNMRFVDEEQGVEAEVEEVGCAAEDGGVACDYTLGISGASYDVTLWYGRGGEVRLLEIAGQGQDFDGQLLLLVEGAREGDEEDVEEGGNAYTVSLEDIDDEAEDAGGGEHAGCDHWRYETDGDGAVDAWVCDGVGLVTVEITGNQALLLLREP